MGRNTNLLLLGAGAVVAYLIYKEATKIPQAVNAGYKTAVQSFSDWLSDTFGPTANIPTFYTVVFDDGSSHAVNSALVDAQGNFTWTGYPAGSLPAVQYQLMVGSDGTKYAISG